MRDKVLKIISKAISGINEELDYDSLRNVTEQTTIYGGADGIDSLSLVMLVSEVEGDVNDAFDANVVLASEKAMSMKNSPYNTVGAFADFILSELEGS